MSRHSHSIHSLSDEEKMGLLDNRSVSDVDSDSGRDDQDHHRLHFEKWAGPILAPMNYVRSTPWRVYLVRFAWFFVPSYLQGRHAREQIRPAKLAPTAYLDGMRGVAALVVLFCHFFYQAFVIAKGWGCDDAHYNILKLPIIRLWYQGPPAVCLFFVISGYALSYRPLKLIRGRNIQDFSTTMSSLVFRRGIRLYLPTAISTLMIVSFIRLGVYEWTREFAMDRTFMRNVREPHPSRLPTNYAQFAEWAKDMFDFVHVFGWKTHGGSTNYDQHLWTIPVEFRCSLYLFLTLIATARLRSQYRFITVAGIMLFTYRNSRWEFLMFLCGMVLAEIDLVRGAHVSPPALPIEEKTQSNHRRWYQSAFWAIFSIASLYLMSQPDEGGDRTPGWIYLTSLIPKWWAAEKYRYWQCTGAVMFVLAVSRSSNWQRVFNSAFVQYLGKISYALYLMHGPAIHAVGYHFERWSYSVTGTEGHRFTAGFVLSSFFVIPTIFWWADIFWRAIDIPTVKFAKWWENKLIVKSD
ncbi:acyltransferase [Fusarium mundagurra]|uniref:Acyltransferase n=1 Tax=Fusarium mundagurra TaxID=1567541 RepID=A0A8H6CZD3_9HYPO|nr:acyltransferase [Fusarium mundagurra]